MQYTQFVQAAFHKVRDDLCVSKQHSQVKEEEEDKGGALRVYDRIVGDCVRMKARLMGGMMKGIKFEVEEMVRIQVVLFVLGDRELPYLQNYPLLISVLLFVFPEVQAFDAIRAIQKYEVEMYLREKQVGSYAAVEVIYFGEKFEEDLMGVCRLRCNCLKLLIVNCLRCALLIFCSCFLCKV
jgi:hypothetical protein